MSAQVVVRFDFLIWPTRRMSYFSAKMPSILHLAIPRIRAHLSAFSGVSGVLLSLVVPRFRFKEKYPMKRSWRWYLAWGIMVASLSMLLFMVTAGPAMAWTQNESYQRCDSNGKNCVVHLCGNTSDQPCLLWQEPRNTSIKLYFYMDPSLSTALGSVNFVSILQSAFSQYNSISAWNPYMYVWQSGNPTVGGSYQMLPPSSFASCSTLGGTFTPDGGLPGSSQATPAKQGLNPARGVTEWYSFILYPPVYFNAGVHWNTNMQYSDDGNCNVSADAKKVATHETGHAIGLGHTWKTNPDGSLVPAIMHQGEVPGTHSNQMT